MERTYRSTSSLRRHDSCATARKSPARHSAWQGCKGRKAGRRALPERCGPLAGSTPWRLAARQSAGPECESGKRRLCRPEELGAGGRWRRCGSAAAGATRLDEARTRSRRQRCRFMAAAVAGAPAAGHGTACALALSGPLPRSGGRNGKQQPHAGQQRGCSAATPTMELYVRSQRHPDCSQHPTPSSPSPKVRPEQCTSALGATLRR
jgi:hypothetical protein